MIIQGITAQQFREIVEKVSTSTYAGNLRAEVGTEYSKTRFNGRVTVADSGARMFGQKIKQSAPGARRSWSGRRIAASCWHAYRDVLAGIFDVNPDARVYTALAKYRGREGFLAEYPKTAGNNVGSIAQPAYMPDLCDCEHYGIDTGKTGDRRVTHDGCAGHVPALPSIVNPTTRRGIMTTHTITTEWVPNNHGYPYRAVCSCGQWQSNTYAARHAADDMADEHRKEVLAQ